MSRFSADKSTVSVTFIEADGRQRPLDVPVASNLMRIAKVSGVDIWARCGAGLKCATCHVKVDPEHGAALPPPRAAELETLSLAENRGPESRLACQLHASPEFEGMELRVMCPRPKTRGSGR